MNNLDEYKKLGNQLSKMAEESLKQLNSPEITKHFTNEHRQLLDKGLNAFKFNGATLDEKMEELNKTYKDAISFNK